MDLQSLICNEIDLDSPMTASLSVGSPIGDRTIVVSSIIQTSMLIRSLEYADVNTTPIL